MGTHTGEFEGEGNLGANSAETVRPSSVSSEEQPSLRRNGFLFGRFFCLILISIERGRSLVFDAPTLARC